MQITRRRQQKGRRPRRLLVCLALIVAVLGSTMFVTPKADAWGWSKVYRDPNGIQIYACKTAIVSGYGPLYKINYFMHNSPNSGELWLGKMMVFRSPNNAVIHNHRKLLRPGQYASGTVYLSRVLPDRLFFGILNNDGELGGDVSMGFVRNC